MRIDKKEKLKLENFSDKLMKNLLKEKVDDIIIKLINTKSQQIKFSSNKINISKDWNNSRIDLFTNTGGKIVTTSLKDFSDRGIKDLLRSIKIASDTIPKNDSFFGIQDKKLIKQSVKEIKNKKLYDKEIEFIGDKTIDLVDGAINVARDTGADEIAGVFETDVIEETIKTSKGIEGQYKKTDAYFSIRALAGQEGSGHSVSVGTNLKNVQFNKISEKASRIANLSINPISKKISGKYNVLFEPLPMADFIERVGDATSIFSVESGMSFFLNKLNKDVASKKFTLYDDGTKIGGLGTVPFDEEGTPTQKTPLIVKGQLKNYLHSHSTAKRYGIKSTGNAGIISPSPHNLVVEKGDKSFENMISNMKKGIYVTNLWYTRFKDYVEGTFSTIPRDGIFYVENGEIKYPIKNIRISDNILNIINNVDSVGKEVQQIYSWEVSTPTFTPHILVKDVNITRPR